MKKNDRLATPSSRVPTGSLTAKEIVFVCTDSFTDCEILRQISNVLASGVTRFGSATGRAWLVSATAGEFIEAFWSSLQSLNEGDREAVQVVILSRLKQVAKVRRGGRPKGAKGQDTDQQAAALEFLGCSRTGMVPVLKPTHHRKATAKQAVEKLLRRHAVSIKKEYANMNEALALKMVKANVTIELAERILKSTS